MTLAWDAPPWRPIPSRKLANLLGVSLQVLANWRVRGTGPEPEPMQRGKGNRIFYRPDKVLAWLCPDDAPFWQQSGYWLAHRGLIGEPRDRGSIDAAIKSIDQLGF